MFCPSPSKEFAKAGGSDGQGFNAGRDLDLEEAMS